MQFTLRINKKLLQLTSYYIVKQIIARSINKPLIRQNWKSSFLLITIKSRIFLFLQLLSAWVCHVFRVELLVQMTGYCILEAHKNMHTQQLIVAGTKNTCYIFILRAKQTTHTDQFSGICIHNYYVCVCYVQYVKIKVTHVYLHEHACQSFSNKTKSCGTR